MSDIDQRSSNEKFIPHRLDKKGFASNSMIHHKLVLPTTPRHT
jgi:hypothetical protein